MADDKTLIFRARAGDEQAFADLVGRYHAFVYGVVIGIIKNVNDAEEVVQDVFLNTYRGLSQLEDATKFKGWLAEIARNCARDRMRKQRVNTVPIDEVSEHTLQTSDSLDARLIRDEQRALIRSAMESLSDKDKEIAQAYYLDGESYDELIRIHGLSYKAISFRLSRAKRKLSKLLRHLLTGVFVSPATTLKQICTGGLTAMKVGTASKITVSAAAIIGLGVFGPHHFISSKKDLSPSVEIVTSTPSESTHSVTRTDVARKQAVTAPGRADDPQISAEEMEQIESFFAQLEEIDAQDLEKTEEALPSEMDNEVPLDTSEIEVVSDPQEERFFGLTRSQIEEKIAELRTKIPQTLQERLDLLDFVEELAEFSREDEEIYLLRREAFEKTRELRKTIFALRREYTRYSDGDISPFQPGGEFYDLFAQNHIGVKRIVE